MLRNMTETTSTVHPFKFSIYKILALEQEMSLSSVCHINGFVQTLGTRRTEFQAFLGQNFNFSRITGYKCPPSSIQCYNNGFVQTLGTWRTQIQEMAPFDLSNKKCTFKKEYKMPIYFSEKVVQRIPFHVFCIYLRQHGLLPQ